MTSDDPIAEVEAIVARARAAQRDFEHHGSQTLYDRAAQAAAWAIMEPERNRNLAECAVRTTGLGNVADKIIKNHRKTLGLMRDIKHAQTFGIIGDYATTGITEIARPMGVIGAVVPSTNPGATPANNIINAVKCGNAIVVSPSPKGVPTCEMLIENIHTEFDKIGVNRDLVQMIPGRGSKEKTQRLLEIADLIVVTGSQNNVRRAYTSGTPALAVGAGNVVTIVDETADLFAAAEKIKASKTFDNATSCSSENAVVVVDEIYDAFVDAMAQTGGALITDDRAIIDALWIKGTLNPRAIAKDPAEMIDALGLTGQVPEGTEYLAVETNGIGPDHPLSGEKLSRVLSVYRAKDFAHAVALTGEIQSVLGAGHSAGIHTTDTDRPVTLARAIPTSRVIVNQAHTFATGGSFTNGMPFSLSMGCGSWGGNSIDTNLHWRHFMQTTKVVREIPANEPTLDDIFAEYWAQVGQ